MKVLFQKFIQLLHKQNYNSENCEELFKISTDFRQISAVNHVTSLSNRLNFFGQVIPKLIFYKYPIFNDYGFECENCKIEINKFKLRANVIRCISHNLLLLPKVPPC